MSRKSVSSMAIKMQSLQKEMQSLKRKLNDLTHENMRLRRVESEYNKLLNAYVESESVVKAKESWDL